MSLFTAVKTFFSGGSDTASKVLDAGIAGVDKLILTDEERHDIMQAIGDQWVDTQKVLQDESSIRSVTRRILSFLVVVPFVMLVLAAAVSYKFDAEYAQFLLALADSRFGLLVTVVAGFYFGPHMIGRALNKAGKG